MNKIIYLAFIAIAITTSGFKIANNAAMWQVKEDKYTVKFTSKKFDGVFKGLKSEINFDENNLSNSKITASINATTINTGNGLRNKHARQGLDVEKYPIIKFSSTTISKTTVGFEAIGILFIKDVSKQIKLPFTFIKNADGGIFGGSFTIKPADFNVTKNGTPENLTIQLNIPVTK